MAAARRPQSCPAMEFSEDIDESISRPDEGELYMSVEETTVANAPGSGSHMSEVGVAVDSLSLSTLAAHNTLPSPSGPSQSQDTTADSNVPSLPAVSQSEAVSHPVAPDPAPPGYPFIVSTPLAIQKDNKMNPHFGSGVTNYSGNTLIEGSMNKDQLAEQIQIPAFYQEHPQGQGFYSFDRSGMANAVVTYNPQFAHNMGGQAFSVQPTDLNMMPADPSGFNETVGNRLKELSPAKKLEITAYEFLACAESGVENGAKNSMPSNAGVLKLSNIPYSLTKEEVISLMGRNAKLLKPETGCAVHIIMERSTAKTMDCFVEFETPGDAVNSARYLNSGLPANPPRLGSRFIEVEVTTQDELLRALFPRAKCVSWRHGVPHVLQNTDPYSTGFQGFFTYEEFYNVVRHAEHPRRAPFAEKCPQRTYENMISTMYKFPWYATTMYSIEDRNVLCRSVHRQIVALDDIMKKKNTIGLNERLMQDLVLAALCVPVFNERQKISIFLAAKAGGIKNVPMSSKAWPFDALTRKLNVPEEAVMQFANFMAQGSQIHVPGTALLANKWTEKEHSASGGLFGKVWFEWGLDNTHHKFQFAVDHEMQIIRDTAKALAQAELKKRTG